MSGEKNESATEKSQAQIPEPSPEVMPPDSDRDQHEAAHESQLFPPGAGSRYFGTGGYATGGSNAEGNYGIGELNARGGYGSFTDAGGPGASTLYGEEPPVDLSEDDESDPPKPDADKTPG